MSSFRQHGFGAVELLVVLGMVGVFMMMAVSNLRELDDPLLNGSSQLVGFLKQVRAKAFASTSAYTISPDGANRLKTEFAHRCSDVATTLDPKLNLEFPTGVLLTDTGWTLCISSRGLPDANLTIEVADNEYHSKQVEIMLGGAVRVLP